jgi:hypothetical protein
MLYGENVDDHETLVDEKLLKEYQLMLTKKASMLPFNSVLVNRIK